MNEAERNAELLRLNEESRQNVKLLHAGKLTEGEFILRMEAIRETAGKVLVAPRTDGVNGNGKER